mgnify:CR=1 FL=1
MFAGAYRLKIPATSEISIKPKNTQNKIKAISVRPSAKFPNPKTAAIIANINSTSAARNIVVGFSYSNIVAKRIPKPLIR